MRLIAYLKKGFAKNKTQHYQIKCLLILTKNIVVDKKHRPVYFAHMFTKERMRWDETT